jgi:hypothetical protein
MAENAKRPRKECTCCYGQFFNYKLGRFASKYSRYIPYKAMQWERKSCFGGVIHSKLCGFVKLNSMFMH